MAVPKKKKSSSATKRQRNAYVISQHKKILKKVDAEIRCEKNREQLDSISSKTEKKASTVIAA